MQIYLKNISQLKIYFRNKFPGSYKIAYYLWWHHIRRKLWLLINKPKGVLVYVGLNKGDFFGTLYYKYEYSFGYEANPYLFNILKKKFKNKKNVKIFNLAASNKNSVEDFYISNNKDMVSSSLSKFSNKLIEKVGYKKSIKVRTVNLGDHLQSLNINSIDEYLSDAQGYDLVILKSLKKFIINNKIKKIICEVTINNKINHYFEVDNFEKSFDKFLPLQYIKASKGISNLVVGKFEKVPSAYNYCDVMWINNDFDKYNK